MLSPNNQIQNVNQGALLPSYVSSNIISIHGGRDGALNYPLQPNYKGLLVDEENKMAYVRINNQIIGEFYYEDVTPQENKPFDVSNFATKEDLQELMKEIKKLQNNKKNVGHRYNNKNFDKPRRNYSNG